MRKRKPITAVLIVCVAAALALPVAASATWQAGDSPTVVIREGLGPSRAPAAVPSATSVNHTSTTLPIVLAAVALGIALTGTAYVTVRLRSLQRT